MPCSQLQMRALLSMSAHTYRWYRPGSIHVQVGLTCGVQGPMLELEAL